MSGLLRDHSEVCGGHQGSKVRDEVCDEVCDEVYDEVYDEVCDGEYQVIRCSLADNLGMVLD